MSVITFEVAVVEEFLIGKLDFCCENWDERGGGGYIPEVRFLECEYRMSY